MKRRFCEVRFERERGDGSEVAAGEVLWALDAGGAVGPVFKVAVVDRDLRRCTGGQTIQAEHAPLVSSSRAQALARSYWPRREGR